MNEYKQILKLTGRKGSVCSDHYINWRKSQNRPPVQSISPDVFTAGLPMMQGGSRSNYTHPLSSSLT